MSNYDEKIKHIEINETHQTSNERTPKNNTQCFDINAAELTHKSRHAQAHAGTRDA